MELVRSMGVATTQQVQCTYVNAGLTTVVAVLQAQRGDVLIGGDV